MGLDVFLHKCDNLARKTELEGKYYDFQETAWEFGGRDYNQLTDTEKEQARSKTREYAVSIGLAEDGDYKGDEKIKVNSSKYPDHYFKIGYFRSSYNDSGYNSLMRRAGLGGLYDIFDAENGERAVPDWEQSLERAKQALKELREYRQTDAARFDAMDQRADQYGDAVRNEQDALNVFMEQYRSHRDSPFGNSYSNGRGLFMLDGRKVFAVIPGTDILKGKCVYLICERPAEWWDWYEQALEIVIETIEYVLTQPDKEQYYLVWSG